MEAFNPCSMTTLQFPYSSYSIPSLTTYTTPTAPTTTPPPPPPPPDVSLPILDPWMDNRIWSRLPTSLVDRILTFLPPPSFFRARSVCKRWYSLMYSNSFLQLYLHISPHRHWFIFFTNTASTSTISNNKNTTTTTPKRAHLFDPYELTWHTIPFPLIPSGFSPAASSGGLVCWVLDDPGPKTLFLHNPLVGSTLGAHLPPTLRPRFFPAVGLNITPSSIDLTLAGDDLISPYAVKNLTTESFHVDCGGFFSVWTTASCLPRLCSLESGQMTYSSGRFYCMNHSPFSVLTYDISSNTWWKVQAPMRRFLRSPSLVESKGRVVLVAAVEKNKLNVPRSLRVWGLQGCGTQWVEIERMPHPLYVQFGEEEGGRGFHCVGHGEFIVIMIKGVNKGLMFDIERKRWVWMPSHHHYHDHHRDGDGGGDLQGFAYEPRLATPVTALVDHLPFHSFSTH